MTKNHNYYLDLAYQLAEKNLGKTGLNPSVGAIVVKDNSEYYQLKPLNPYLKNQKFYMREVLLLD